MAKTTPMMQQYRRIKEEYSDAILFFRLGDFYEMFSEDALKASKALEITLTTRGKGTADAVPMCGVPWHSADRYIARLIRQGFKVAICDQVQEASQSKGLVEREVVRVITPGTDLSEGNLDPNENNFLGAICPQGDRIGSAFLDGSTGEFWLMEEGASETLDALSRFRPREIIFPEGSESAVKTLAEQADLTGSTCSSVPPWEFEKEEMNRRLTSHFRVKTLEGFGINGMTSGIGAAGAALSYLKETQRTDAGHVVRLRRHDPSTRLRIDEVTRRNLELTRTLRDNSRAGSLLQLLDETATPMGSRTLQSWLLAPLQEIERIQTRQEGVGELLEGIRERNALHETLKEVADLERLTSKARMGRATPRDLGSILRSLEKLPELTTALDGLGAPIFRRFREEIDTLPDLRDRLRLALVDEPPIGIREGGIVRKGYNKELDELRSAAKGGKELLGAIEDREKKRTGIASLKVRHNKVFGYFLEVSKSNLSKVPEDWVRRQTLANAERFVTEELKQVEERVLGAQDRAIALEESLFLELRDAVGASSQTLLRTASALAAIDVLCSFAITADRHGYICPQIQEERGLRITGGRHPVVERLLEGERFVPNDCHLDPEDCQLALLTGPNMGGKSTYLRQNALIALLAHTGSYVPAESATIGRIDRIFTRVGASDSLSHGQSTFMVEMLETANILNNATERSLVVLDEIGRGTATFDGLSLAWAVAEHLHNAAGLGCMTLFATHYHELTDLSRTLPRVQNLRVAVREWKDQIVFLRRVEEGTAERSYGIHVARLAGLPAEVLQRASEVLRNLESNELDLEGKPRLAKSNAVGPSGESSLGQMALFHSPQVPPEVEEILRADLSRLTPLEALNFLDEVQRRLRTSNEEAAGAYEE